MSKIRGTKTIALEEHYATPAYVEIHGKEMKQRTQLKGTHPQVESYDDLVEKLCNVGEGRIANMDAAGIDVQVMSLTSPGTEDMEPVQAESFARESNDFVAKGVKMFPSRLAAFAALPSSAPEKAADELERTVKEYDFKGGLINGNIHGRFLDDRFFWPILERAESLNVPLYIHPAVPPKPIVDIYYKGDFQPGVVGRLSTSGWGWHIETALHVIRLILSGAFDQYPKLHVIIGHLGEAIPFMITRLEQNLSTSLTKLNRPISSYLRENVHYTISGFNYVPPFLNLLLQIGVDQIMFSSDYPYSSMSDSRSFLDNLPISPADRERIGHVNAERLMKF